MALKESIKRLFFQALAIDASRSDRLTPTEARLRAETSFAPSPQKEQTRGRKTSG